MLTLGSAVCTALSDMFKEKKIVRYILRSVAVAMIIGFIGYLIPFKNAMLKFYEKKLDMLEKVNPVFISILVLTVVSAVAAIVDLVLTVTIKDE